MDTYLLLDFENVAPATDQIAALEGEDIHLWIFRGPKQTKFDAELAVALQPLGRRVQHVKGPSEGRNALDFVLAYHLGALVAGHRAAGIEARYVIVSRDKGFDSLVRHVHDQAIALTRAESVAAALGRPEAAKGRGAARAADDGVRRRKAAGKNAARAADAPKAEARAEARSDARSGTKAETKQKAAAKTAGRRKGKAPADASAAATPVAAAAVAPVAAALATAAKGALRDELADGDLDQVVASLRANAKHRPTDRKALENQVVSFLKQSVTPRLAQQVVDGLEASGAIAFEGRKVVYKLAKGRSRSRGKGKASAKPEVDATASGRA